MGVDKRLTKNKKLLSDLLEKEKEYRNNEGSARNNLQTVKMKWKQLLRIVSPKRPKKMIWKRKATTRIATLKALQSYSKRIQMIRVNTVKAQMFITLLSSTFGNNNQSPLSITTANYHCPQEGSAFINNNQSPLSITTANHHCPQEGRPLNSTLFRVTKQNPHQTSEGLRQ